MKTGPSFNGLRVLVLESRRSREMASLVTTYGGEPIAAPSMREVPLESNTEALAFADRLLSGDVDIVVFLTGVGARALVDLVDQVQGRREPFIDALRRVAVVARGPKPLGVMRDLKVPVALTAPEPNTWRELLRSLDEAAAEVPLSGRRVAVQEYGSSNRELLDGLRARGAEVSRVPIYQWALPEDLGPLRAGVRAIAEGRVDVAMFTTATQAVHLMLVADELGVAGAVREQLRRLVVASIGPTTSEELQQQGFRADMEPSHPKMGFLVREAAEQAAEILTRKRA